ncbi:MAG: hypothetical protein FJX72_20035 [Armatimonadetes bacterium]|nr:hypothetical protein [Armatimonadota bacterium]
MAGSSRRPESAYAITHSDAKLVVERRGEPFRKRYIALAALLLIVLALLMAYLLGAQTSPRLWFLVGLIAVMLLVLSERAYRMLAAMRPDRLVFDKDANTVERNGDPIGAVKDIEAVLFRDILDGERPTNEHAVTILYENTRRTLVGESHGLPGEKETLDQVASAIAEYVGVPVRNEPRQVAEWWLDRS